MLFVVLLACAPEPDTAPAPVEGAPANWWTWSWECSKEANRPNVTVPALPTTDPLLVTCAHVYENAIGTVALLTDCPDLPPDGGALALCDEGDVSGRITVAW